MPKNFNLSQEDQDTLEKYLNNNGQVEDPRYDPSSLGEFLPSMPDISMDDIKNTLGIGSGLQVNNEMKADNTGYFGNKLPAQMPEQPGMGDVKMAEKAIQPSPVAAPRMPASAPQMPQTPAIKEPSPMEKLLGDYQKLYSSDQLQSDADLMNQALDRKKQLAMLDMFMKSGAQIAGGLAQTKPAETIQTAGLADIDIEKAKQKAGLTDKQRMALEAQMKILDMKEMHDSSSPTSKFYQQTLKEMMPQIAKIPELANASASGIAKVFPLVQTKLANDARLANQKLLLSMRAESLEQRKKEASMRERKDQITTARGLLKDDPRFKPAIEQGMEFENVGDLLTQAENHNEAAVAALGAKLARAMGEKGVLTDTDVVRYVQGTSWGTKLKTWFEKGAKGSIPSSIMNDIKKNLSLLRKNLNGNIDKVYNNAQKRMKTAYPDLDDQVISGLLGRVNFPERKQAPVEAPKWNDFEDME